MSFQVVDLPPKAHLCKVKTLNKGDANSEVTVYYQVGIRTTARCEGQNLGSSCGSVCSVGPEEPQRTRSNGADGGEFLQASTLNVSHYQTEDQSPSIKNKSPELVWLPSQMHMEEPCFDFLRTKETLGSVVSAPSRSSLIQEFTHPGVLRLFCCFHRYQVYSSCRNTCGLLSLSPWKHRPPSSGGFGVTSPTFARVQ